MKYKDICDNLDHVKKLIADGRERIAVVMLEDLTVKLKEKVFGKDWLYE